jgi:putative transposase
MSKSEKTSVETRDAKEGIVPEVVLVGDSESLSMSPATTRKIRDLIAGQTEPTIGAVTENAWRTAVRRGEALKELFSAPAKLSSVRAVATQYNVDPSTLYRWLERYQSGGGRISALLRSTRSDAAVTRLDPKVEVMLEKAVSAFLDDQRRTVTSLWDDLEADCHAAGVDAPHINTLRNRIKQISEHLQIASRFGAKLAREKYGQLPRVFQGAMAPHALVQVDHTKVDIIVLDEDTREPIGRPWITVVLDIYSRVVLGFHLSLDPPGTLAVGLALAHAVLPKRPWLDRLGLSLVWPCQGLVGCVYPDNGLEFHGSMLERACQEYGIDLQFRPLARTEFGGHIERFMRTLGENVHALPGTTFSDVKEKGDYDSAAHACMTLSELEIWMTHFIAGVYHNRPHRGIGNQTPLQRYEEWFRVHGSQLGVEVAPMPDDERRFRLDLLPFEMRTIQRGGVEMHFGHIYQDDILRPFIGMKDPQEPTKGQRYHFSYDPRDISIAYFWHPVMAEYIPIPWKDTSLRPMSLWEARSRAGQAPPPDPEDRQRVRTSRRAMGELQEKAKAKTQGARRQATRAKIHRTENIHQTLADTSPNSNPPDSQPVGLMPMNLSSSESWSPVVPFIDVE